MINKFKKLLYFPIASYFKFFAQIRLRHWKPRIVVITGSSGKTTLLHLIESQLKKKAKYSHQANSSFGIPFDILDLKRKNLTPDEWLYLFLAAPFAILKKTPKEKLYVVEADCDRPNEGKFLADLLKPEVTLWTGVGRTHTMNFDSAVKKNACHCEEERRSNPIQERLPHQSTDWFTMTQVEEAIANEFGFYLEATSKLAIVNGDSDLITSEIKRSKAEIKTASLKNTEYYKISKNHTEFKINGKNYLINALLPKEASLSVQMTLILLDYLNIKPDYSFSRFSLPPGRCNLFKGIKDTIIIDSSYNATPDGVKSILSMFDAYPSEKKWLVLGDMIELGSVEQEEHEKLGSIINEMRLEKVVLVGPRVSKYIYHKLLSLPPHPNPLPRGEREWERVKIETFLMPKDALDYLERNLKGREAILFKGARFLEGIIEHLLADKKDVKKLCRREKIWQERRKKWGL